MSDQVTVAVIESVSSKEGATNGRAWRKFTVKTDGGIYYSTFDAPVAELANTLVGHRAEIAWKASGQNGEYRDVTAIKAAVGDPGPLPTARTETGAADWDVIGLRKTRCLLWAHFLQSPLALHIAEQASGEPASHRIAVAGTAIITQAERDIYLRPIAVDEDGIPF